ncbi:hypothetical protein FB451DRAFT_1187774 [Mycena latifolia]|nr:hypothetical protein FB451DRAFT_1187774 [Mycena latifolia]
MASSESARYSRPQRVLSSSLEGVHPPVAAQIIPTPAPSQDLGSEPQIAEAHDSAAEVDKFEDFIRTYAQSSPINPLELPMAPDTADAVRERLSEEGNFKMLIVTYRSSVHQSFKSIVRPFRHIADVDGSFNIRTGVEILVKDETSGIPRPKIPDFVFGKKASGPDAHPVYGIVVECGYSQSFLDLTRTLQRWFSTPDVQTVVHIQFFCEQLDLPTTEFPVTGTAVSRATFCSELSSLGPIKFDGYTWAPAIKKVTVTIYYEDKEALVIDITADQAAVELLQAQSEITETLYFLTSAFIGPEKLEVLYPRVEDFSISWDDFYIDLKGHLAADGYIRYRKWASPRGDPNYVPSVRFYCSNLLERLGEISTDARAGKLLEPKKYTLNNNTFTSKISFLAAPAPRPSI